MAEKGSPRTSFSDTKHRSEIESEKQSDFSARAEEEGVRVVPGGYYVCDL